jgi:hypothetical protein
MFIFVDEEKKKEQLRKEQKMNLLRHNHHLRNATCSELTGMWK